MYFSNWWKSLVLTIGIGFSGRVFVYLNEKIGILTASLFHMGADAAVIVVMFLIIYYVDRT